jgi:hypothetical protein
MNYGKLMSKKKIYIILPAIMGILFGLYSLFHDTLLLGRYRTMPSFQNDQAIKTEGLAELRMSGSNEIVFYDLKWRLRDITGPIYILDLTGGLVKYYHSIPDTTFIHTKHNSKVACAMRRLLAMGSFTINPEILKTEKEVADQYGFIYMDYLIDSRSVPRPEKVDELIQFLNQLPKDAWIHVHCNKGKGRTSVVMNMVDILKNGHLLPVEEIVKRQFHMGSVDLFDTNLWTKGTYTKEQLENRKEFITQFHRYVNDPQGYGHTSWQEWCKTHNLYFHKLANNPHVDVAA